MNRWVFWVGATLLLVVPLGLSVSVFGWVLVWDAMEMSPGDPKIAAGVMAKVLVTQGILVVMALPGTVLVSLAILAQRLRGVGYRRVLGAVALMQALIMPVGLVPGLYTWWLASRAVRRPAT